MLWYLGSISEYPYGYCHDEVLILSVTRIWEVIVPGFIGVYVGVVLGYIGMMEKKMETTI